MTRKWAAAAAVLAVVVALSASTAAAQLFASCDPGFGRVTGQCVRCPAGQFSLGGPPATAICLPCVGSSVSRSPGQARCDACPTNTIPNPTKTACVSTPACVRGSGFDRARMTCTVCAAGTFSPGGQNAFCQRCPANHVATTAGRASCTICCSGTIPNAANTACVTAPTCQAGFGVASATCARCSAGTYSAGGQNARCMTCPAGRVATTAGRASCTACPAGQAPNPARTACQASSAGATCPQCRELFSQCVAQLGCTPLTTFVCASAMSACRVEHPCIANCPAA
jgi:hypothetical protein